MSWKDRSRTFVGVGMIVATSLPSWGIGKKEFFERLDQSLTHIQTFQSDVWQESRYPDGVVQQYRGELAVSPDGRIAYKYEQTSEDRDFSIVPKGEAAAPTDRPSTDHDSKGTYVTQGNRVNQYLPDQNLIVESPEDGNLLIKLFQALVGAGDFDLEKFKEEHKILRIVDESLDGEPVFVMVAEPKKNSSLYRDWASQTRTDISNWRQELWVTQADFQPVFARLHSAQESTSVRLIRPRINQSMEGDPFRIQLESGTVPKKIRQGNLGPTGEAIETRPTVEQPLQSIPLE